MVIPDGETLPDGYGNPLWHFWANTTTTTTNMEDKLGKKCNWLLHLQNGNISAGQKKKIKKDVIVT
jgi:hypothetical protein